MPTEKLKTLRRLVTAKLFLICCAITAFAWLLFANFSVMEQGTNTMEPVIFGQGNPPTKNGDLLLIAKSYPKSGLRAGDLVVAELPTEGGLVLTVRAVEAILPPSPTNRQSIFYLKALSESGIDSDDIGFLTEDQLQGKVIWIWHRRH